MDRKLAALLLREVFLPGKYPYHINISSDDYSDNDIEKCMLDMEKEGTSLLGAKSLSRRFHVYRSLHRLPSTCNHQL